MVCLLASVLMNAQEAFRNYALFDYNSYELTSQSKSMIDSMLNVIGNKKIEKVELYGHTDSDGDAQANQILSQNRVNTVKAYLLTKGISESVFVTEHFGESKPAFSNTSEAGMQKNRRVEITFNYAYVPPQPPSPVVQRTPFELSQPSKPRKSLPVVGTKQVFTGNTKKEIDITGANGTHFVFQKNCFRDSAGNTVNGEITIEMVEVYTKDQMILHNLHTTSSQKLLESGGMAYVNAYNSNGKLNLVSYMPYTVEFPASNKINGMQLFYGDTSSGNLNWVVKSSGGKGGDWDYIAQQALDKYVFTSAKMGWINCDHFLGDYDVTDLYIDSPDTAGVSFCLVFRDINSAMLRDMTSDEIKFRNVPIGATVTIIAFRKTETGAFYASKEVTLQDQMRESIVMTELKEEEFQKEITGLQ
jgi:hypothetical protein